MLAFGKHSDCCLFIFYQAILLSFLINSEIFSNNYLGISRHIITSFVNHGKSFHNSIVMYF